MYPIDGVPVVTKVMPAGDAVADARASSELWVARRSALSQQDGLDPLLDVGLDLTNLAWSAAPAESRP